LDSGVIRGAGSVGNFFPVEDTLLGDSQEFGDLAKGDDEGFGVDAMAYGLHGRLLLVNGLAVETTAIQTKPDGSRFKLQ
jgi:hypothetical protein